jgi:hypothetical protein
MDFSENQNISDVGQYGFLMGIFQLHNRLMFNFLDCFGILLKIHEDYSV